MILSFSCWSYHSLIYLHNMLHWFLLGFLPRKGKLERMCINPHYFLWQRVIDCE